MILKFLGLPERTRSINSKNLRQMFCIVKTLAFRIFWRFMHWCSFFPFNHHTKVKFDCWYADCCIQLVINDLGIQFSGKDKTWFFCPLEKKVLSDQKIYSFHVLVIHRDNSWAWRLQFIFRFLYLSANIFHTYKMTGLRLQHDGSVVHPYLLNFYMILSVFRDDMCLWFRLAIAVP